MNGRYGPPPHRRPSDPRMQHYGPAASGPPLQNGGRFPPGRGGPPGRGFNGRGPPGRFDDRGRGRAGGGRMSPGRFGGRGMRDAGAGRGPPVAVRPPPPPPPGRGFRGRGMLLRGMPARGPVRAPMHVHPQARGPPPPPPRGRPQMVPPPPPPGRGIPGRGPAMHHAPPPGRPSHSYAHPPAHPGMHPHQQQAPIPHGAPPTRQHSAPHVHGHAHPHPAHQPQHSVQTAVHIDKSAYTKEQIEQGWTEHTAPNSTKYYFNSITQESTYTKPDCLIEKESVSSEADSATKQQKQTWAEYTDPSTGKKYYSDGVTTTWERPPEMGGAAEVQSDDVEGPKKKKRKKTTEQEMSEFNNSAEATAAFKGLLLAKGVQPTTKWNEVVKMCSSDSRWEACEVLSLGERKQALAEYQTKRANELRTLERQERMRAKEAFVQLLTEKLPTIEEFSATSSHFSDIRNALAKDDRFYAVEKEETRESLFLDFCEEVRKRDERKKRSKKREAKDDFLAFLKEREEQGVLTFASTWASFVGTLEKSHRNDPRFQASPSLPESERELCFADHVLELQAAEEERRRRIRDARRRAEKAQKEAYTDALRKMASEGSLLPSSRWRNVEALIAADPSFAPVQAHERDSPREIFEDWINEWNEVYRRDRSFLSNLVHSSAKHALSVHAETPFDEYSRALLDQAAHSPELYSETRGILNREDPISSARLYFNELVSTARDSQAKPLKRSKSGSRRGSADSSSEDEGEIREDGEVSGDEDEAADKDTSDEQK